MGEHVIDWRDLEVSETLPEGDVVTLTTKAGSPDHVEFQLQLAPHITWWKGLEVYDGREHLIQMVECQDDTKLSNVGRIDIRDIRTGGKLILCKMEFGGFK